MTHKLALQSIARMKVDQGTDSGKLLALCMGIALAALQNAGERGELAKERKDKTRAENAIHALESFLANPAAYNCRMFGEQTNNQLIEAARLELVRLQDAVDDPQALKAIYRRNEK